MKNSINKKYWSEEGRKIISIPPQVIKKQRLNNALLSNLYLTDIGYYPAAFKHHTHRKKGCAENILIYCVKGAGWVITEAGKQEIAVNHFIMLPKNKEHEYGASDEDPWSVYWIKFGGQGLSNLNDLPFAKKCFEQKHFAFKADAIQLFTEMFNVLEEGYSKQYLTYVNMVLVNFLSLFLFQRSSFIKSETTNPHDIIIAKTIHFMKENLLTSVTNLQLSNAAGCSGSQLSNLFKSSTGYSPINYFNHLKIQKACQIFYTTNLLVKEIAAQLGYDDPYYFSRLFTKVMGISPSDYRKQNGLK